MPAATISGPLLRERLGDSSATATLPQLARLFVVNTPIRPLADGKPDASSRDGVPVQSLEDAENLLMVLRIDIPMPLSPTAKPYSSPSCSAKIRTNGGLSPRYLMPAEPLGFGIA
jgi:hypothetical protein